MSLELKNISKVVGGENHIHDLSLRLEPGSFNVLLGRTLAGKTTLLRLMAGLERPTGGQLLDRDRDITGVSVRKRNVAMVYQQFINYPAMTVYQNIASPLKLAGVPRKEVDRRVRATAEMMRMSHLLDRRPGELSGGQQQRTAMARALVREADLLLLDEPLVNLDYKLREGLREELRDILRDRDCIVVYATTEPQEALVLGGSVAVLHEGGLIQHGPTHAVYRNPRNIEVARIFNDPPMNLAEGRVIDGEVRIGEHRGIPVPSHLSELAPGKYIFGLRPHHLSPANDSGDRLPIDGHCELTEITGSLSFTHVNDGETSWVAQIPGVFSADVGERLKVYADPSQLFAFSSTGGLACAPRNGDTARGAG
ncbi:MAG: ABC transporter ATP-binding protein [Ectothiorhodospiraceae bacterium]|nr:ABC transporter ATP-binding protein [Ectothiorhodospiraceae bacterium]